MSAYEAERIGLGTRVTPPVFRYKAGAGPRAPRGADPRGRAARRHVVGLQNGSGADPLGALRLYGETVLPALMGARV